MISLSWLQIANPYFQQAVNSIWDCPMLDAKTSYSAHRINQGISSVDKEIKNMRIELCNKYAKKDENGKLITNEKGFVTFETPEKNKEFEDEFQKEFNSRRLELKVTKINFENIISVRGITPRMWEFLEPIMDNLPKDEEALESAIEKNEALQEEEASCETQG